MSRRYESLMRRLEDSDRSEFNHAVLLSYSIDIPFFEETILRALRRRGCGNIAVFADAQHVASAIRETFEHNRGSRVHFGHEYSLTPVHHFSRPFIRRSPFSQARKSSFGSEAVILSPEVSFTTSRF